MGTIMGKGFPQAQVHTVHSTNAEGAWAEIGQLGLGGSVPTDRGSFRTGPKNPLQVLVRSGPQKDQKDP